MNGEERERFHIWRDALIRTRAIAPLEFGMLQEAVAAVLGRPDAVSTMKRGGRPQILKYEDIELHFDGGRPGLFLVYSDSRMELSISAEPAEED
ncbi:hypothetical protein [uncultured Oscillibacter sp.]|uniref:hypothetical protein n=1 Tax=uncultured Oscillibacter sp. TaxID=876091 RepID=UPI0026062235|nr:hypothetical protein [uncultured Oscillibacter sp.]